MKRNERPPLQIGYIYTFFCLTSAFRSLRHMYFLPPEPLPKLFLSAAFLRRCGALFLFITIDRPNLRRSFRAIALDPAPDLPLLHLTTSTETKPRRSPSDGIIGFDNKTAPVDPLFERRCIKTAVQAPAFHPQSNSRSVLRSPAAALLRYKAHLRDSVANASGKGWLLGEDLVCA